MACAERVKQRGWMDPGMRPFEGGVRGPADRRWHPAELAAMIVGFVIFWPIGLMILAWKKWFGLRDAVEGQRAIPQTLATFSGNSAFEDYKQAELRRLEDEYQRLAGEQAAFADYLDRLKQAKDREEFERFMTERRAMRPA